MTIQRYSRQEMQAIISSILGKKITLIPIGNHELRRHLVYKVSTEDGDFVFKYYYQKTYGGREISTLKILENSNIKHAKLISSGTFGKDREWLMMELLNGMPLNKTIKIIPESELIEIFKDMGRELGKIHEIKTFPFFGNLKEDLTFEKKYTDYKKAFLKHNEYVYNRIKSETLEDSDILIYALDTIYSNLHLIEDVKVARLTHSDYCPRNIFVSKENGKRVLKAVLDYELCRPWDKNSDFCHLFLKNFPHNPHLEEAFFSGYREFSSLDENFIKTFDFYMLNLCIGICSWAKVTAPEYYDLAINRLKLILNESKNLKRP